MDLLRLEREIAKLRNEMVRLAKKYDMNFLNPQVLSLSQKLDVLIVQYMKRYKLPPAHKGGKEKIQLNE